eukprot:Blabericola_migrator_1__8378@NODE_4360_length_1200_cov_72_641659_g1858_i3_p1_GENE_NODE_4360_length_1200_cov_72_641659_g1858_i3NODE_4360_length_1200_cov_72_641659_g1858_i3_p1_ORF_typecomplete_len114_score9_58Sgf11/PF08209_11/0_037zfC2H2_8/PF15909_5/4_3zfC2H2_8/PF15909_5/13zfC2H2_aberr/PF17017_5/0_15DUF629/PF04780_12/6_4e02DUF629/PF04780_12/0_69_NODE_4360_length_1200_cov_72_641659_g1858_i3162503
MWNVCHIPPFSDYVECPDCLQRFKTRRFPPHLCVRDRAKLPTPPLTFAARQDATLLAETLSRALDEMAEERIKIMEKRLFCPNGCGEHFPGWPGLRWHVNRKCKAATQPKGRL